VRIIRETRPEVILTMNPSPSPGNLGNLQYGARLAIVGFAAAADPAMFPGQIRREGLRPWRVKRLFRTGSVGTGQPGPGCAGSLVKNDPTDTVGAVWPGPSRLFAPKTWSQLAGEAFGFYVSQGFPPAGFPGSPNPPCMFYAQVAGRVPYSPTNAATDLFDGAFGRAELYLTSERSDLTAGEPVEVTVHERRLHGRAELELPAGWTAERLPRSTFSVTPAADAAPGRYAIGGRVGRAFTRLAVRVQPAVTGRVQRLPAVAQFDDWAAGAGVPMLAGLVKPVLTIGVGETRSVRVDLRNWSADPQSGSVRLELPAGFGAAPAERSYDLAAGAEASVAFAVTNTDTSLPVANRGGDYDTRVATGSSSETFGLELVPVTTVPRVAAAPTLDGVEGAGEYPGPAIDISPRWEGEDCASAADCSGTAKLAWNGDDLYALVAVTDDVLGKKVLPEDCKRHWRTDSVEITLDPRGASENTSTTFKTGIFPATDDPAAGDPPCWERDADHHQGGPETAPGMRVVSKLSSPYSGYVLEVKLPLANLPAAVDPARLGANLFIYDSDTQDLTGQTRLGWSTFQGVQGDPYRWGHARLDGYAPPPDRPTEPPPPIVPSTALDSVDSPQSILQSTLDRVPLGGLPAARDRVEIVSPPRTAGDGMRLSLRASGPGRAHVFAWTDPVSKVFTGADRPNVGDLVVDLPRHRKVTVTVPVAPADRDELRDGGVALVSFAAAGGGTRSARAAVR
jgi:hypothetical protein